LIAQNLAAHKLSILPELELTDVVANFVTKQEKDSIFNYLNRTIDATKSHLELNDDLEDDKKLQEAIVMVKETRARDYEQNMGERPVHRTTASLTVDPRDFERNGENVDLRKFGLDSSQNGFVAKRVLMKKGSSKRTVSASKRRIEDDVEEERPTLSRKRTNTKTKAVSSESDVDDELVEEQLSDVEVVVKSTAKPRGRNTASAKKVPAKSTGRASARTTKQTTLSAFAKAGWSQVDDDIDDDIQIVDTRSNASSQAAPPLVLTEMNNDNSKKRKALPSSLSSQKSKVPAVRNIRKSKFS
jgi:hypothetical protein